MNATKDTTGEGFIDHTAAYEAQHKAWHDAEGLKTSDKLFEMLQTAKSNHARTLIAHATDATRKYEDVRTALGSQLEYIRRVVERAQRELNEEGRTPNPLGILQGNGVEVDRLCGELARTREAAAAAQKLLVELGVA
jgi:hypothetical protein